MKKQNNTTLSQQFQKNISKSIQLIHKYMTVHFAGPVQTLQYKVVELIWFANKLLILTTTVNNRMPYQKYMISLNYSEEWRLSIIDRINRPKNTYIVISKKEHGCKRT